MRKSIQTKIVAVIIAGIICSTLTIGSLGIASFNEELNKSVVSTMNLTCKEKAQELNTALGRIEQSTEVMAVLATNYIHDVENLKNTETRQDYIHHLQDAGYNIANNTPGSIGIYIRLNPELAGPTEGFYWLKDNQTGELKLEPNTDISLYAKDDIEHVGWYYEPIEAGQAIWMDPYVNQNIHAKIVSYAMPIYIENQLVGVVGMDIDWAYITNIVDAIQMYDTGYAFLMDEELDIIYNKEAIEGVNITSFNKELENVSKEELVRTDRVYPLLSRGVEKTAAFATLASGKIMAVVVPDDEINADIKALGLRIISISIVTIVAFVLVTILIARTIIRPLKKLDEAAQSIAQGNLDVELHINSNDEVGTLANSLSETARQLKIRIDYINNLAYSDKLTGVKNSTAYLQEVAYLKNDILQQNVKFSIFVIDVNGLKFVNDNYGHEMGNELIIKAANMVAEVFGTEHLYRIGGDEFAVVSYDILDEERLEYENRFRENLENQKGKVWLSASIGSATYQSQTDANYESVFNRADEDMYEKKLRMKEEGKSSHIKEEVK